MNHRPINKQHQVIYSPNNSDRNSPEHRLWIAVLITFIDDLIAKNKHLKYLERQQVNRPSKENLKSIRLQNLLIHFLIKEAQDEWIKHVCSHIAIDHRWFIESLHKIYASKTTSRPHITKDLDI